MTASLVRRRRFAASRLVEYYSIRRPEIARAMTSCWISDVPSKIVWIFGETSSEPARSN